jgi:hypothetical protein
MHLWLWYLYINTIKHFCFNLLQTERSISFKSERVWFGLVIAVRPQTPKHIRGGWSHYTDTSEPVDGNRAQNMVSVQSWFEPATFRSLTHELTNCSNRALSACGLCSFYKLVSFLMVFFSPQSCYLFVYFHCAPQTGYEHARNSLFSCNKRI